MQYRNIHSHIFTMNNAPQKFLNLYLPDAVANAVDTITNSKTGASVMEWLIAKFGNGGKRYASFLSIGKSSSQKDVFENLFKQYNDDLNMQFVALTMYMERCGAGPSSSGFEGQLEEIIAVKKQYPDRLLIFMGIDPRWKMSGTELRKTVQAYFDKQVYVNALKSTFPFCGIKLYPSTGFYVFDERMKETFEWAAANGIPVLAHCNYLGGIYNNDKQTLQSTLNPFNPYNNTKYDQPKYIQEFSFWKWLQHTNVDRNNKYTCSYFLDPASYEPVLEYFDKWPDPLKICLAHFGGDMQIRAATGIDSKPDAIQQKPYGIKPVNWFTQIQQLMTQYKGLYTDISYALFDKSIHPTFLNELNNAVYGNRIMFGTDYFLTEQEQPEKDTYNNFKTAAMQTTLSNYNNISAWDQAAGNNTAQFLKSKYLA